MNGIDAPKFPLGQRVSGDELSLLVDAGFDERAYVVAVEFDFRRGWRYTVCVCDLESTCPNEVIRTRFLYEHELRESD